MARIELLVLLVAIIAVILLCTLLYRKYFVRPRLVVHLIKGDVNRIPTIEKDSRIKQNTDDSDLPLDCQVTWNSAIKLVNISRHIACYVLVHFKDDLQFFSRYQNLCATKPIEPNEDYCIIAEVSRIEVCRPSEINNNKPFPADSDKVEFVVEYQNISGTRFFTHYTYRDQTNVFLRRKIKGFNIGQKKRRHTQRAGKIWKLIERVSWVAGIIGVIIVTIMAFWPHFFEQLVSK